MQQPAATLKPHSAKEQHGLLEGAYLSHRSLSRPAKGPHPSSMQGRQAVNRALRVLAGRCHCKRSWPAGLQSPTACCCTAGSAELYPGHSLACTIHTGLLEQTAAGQGCTGAVAA